MSVSNRVRKNRSHLTSQSRLMVSSKTHLRRIQEFPKHREGAAGEDDGRIVNHHLVTQRKSLEEIEPIAAIRWLLRKYFEWRGFACRSHCGECNGKCYASIEYRGTFDNEADARWAANCNGGEVKPIPFNAALPEETVSYGVGDVPQSEASQFYRQGVRLPFAAVPRSEIDARLLLEAKIEQVARAASVA